MNITAICYFMNTRVSQYFALAASAFMPKCKHYGSYVWSQHHFNCQTLWKNFQNKIKWQIHFL